MSKEFEKHKKDSFLEYLGKESFGEKHSQDVSQYNFIDCDLVNIFTEEFDFDFFAQDINNWLWIQELVPTLIISSVGGFSDFKVNGFIKDLPFYYKENDHLATLYIYEDIKHLYSQRILYSSNIEVERVKADFNWISTLLTLITNLEKSRFLYSFECLKLEYPFSNNGTQKIVVTDKKDIAFSWGVSPNDAYQNLFKINQNLIEMGVSEETQKEIKLLSSYSLSPIDVDNRVFSVSLDEFEVKVPETWTNNFGGINISF